ncbi:MAG: septum site-determining protein MinC [Myxococcales bacterium]
MLTSAMTTPQAATRAAAAARPAFELKGVMSSLTVLRLRTTDLGLIEQQLRAKVTPLPQFFLDAPVVIDPSALEGGGDGLAWSGLAAVLRMLHLVPVGVTNVGEEHRAAISVARLPIMPLGAGRMRDLESRLQAPAGPMEGGAAPSGPGTQRTAAEAVGNTPAPVPKAGPHRPPLVVRQPVRSGQVVYARRGDLVVLAPVNPGAEVIADGHVHIYAPLRGRAIAGAQGFTEARIFCQRMEAEILSIAGAYLLADDIPEERRGRPVQVYLDERGECRMAAL